MSRKYRLYNDDLIIKSVKESFSIADVCRKLGLVPIGGNYRTIKLNILRLKLDTSHFLGQSWNTYSITDLTKVRSNKQIKRGLIQKNGHRCYQCKLSVWNNKDIPLELEHINGNSLDHSKDNLRLLCPNCHAQTTTYRRRKSSL